MSELQRVNVPKGSESKPYFKYFMRNMAPVPQEKLDMLSRGPADTKKALKLDDREKLFEPGYLPMEVGYAYFDDGSAVVANKTVCRGVTGEMLQWYFAWHPIEPLRYAVWDPFDHYDSVVSDEVLHRLLDPDISIADKCFNSDQLVTESLVMGEPGIPIMIHFRRPSEYGMDDHVLETKQVSFIVCANCEIKTPEGQPDVPVFMLHTARDIEEGCELRSRFWLGCHVINGEAKCMLPPGVRFPEEMAKQLLGHNFNEFTNLAAILPELYNENKNKWE